eukprot:jgi/Mesen1/8780/ME000524S08072
MGRARRQRRQQRQHRRRAQAPPPRRARGRGERRRVGGRVREAAKASKVGAAGARWWQMMGRAAAARERTITAAAKTMTIAAAALWVRQTWTTPNRVQWTLRMRSSRAVRTLGAATRTMLTMMTAGRTGLPAQRRGPMAPSRPGAARWRRPRLRAAPSPAT